MSISTSFRQTTVDFLRKYIGDNDNLMYSDEELDNFLRGRVIFGLYHEELQCQKNHFYSNTPGPVLDLEIINGTDGSTYRVDENTKHIQWISGSAAPADSSQLEISYIDVNFFGTVRDILLQIATDRAKLAIKAKAEGNENDLTCLRAELMKQISELSSIEFWGI